MWLNMKSKHKVTILKVVKGILGYRIYYKELHGNENYIVTNSGAFVGKEGKKAYLFG
jgi:hypothetical protein